MLVRHESFAQNVRQNKIVLRSIAGLLTEEITRRSSRLATWDFRFTTMVAQWLVEQGGYTMTPQGNNPGNVMGSGDAGFFTRSYNTEIVDGKRVPVPGAHFAAYTSMIVGTAATFDHLKNSWPMAYQAILDGASSDAYVNGLFPGKKNYATASKGSYVSGVRFRLKQVVDDYILAVQDDIKECDALAAAIPGTPPAPGGSLDYRNDILLNKNMRSVLENLLAELKELRKRVENGQPVQPK